MCLPAKRNAHALASSTACRAASLLAWRLFPGCQRPPTTAWSVDSSRQAQLGGRTLASSIRTRSYASAMRFRSLPRWMYMRISHELFSAMSTRFTLCPSVICVHSTSQRYNITTSQHKHALNTRHRSTYKLKVAPHVLGRRVRRYPFHHHRVVVHLTAPDHTHTVTPHIASELVRRADLP